jgi:hypothetical protein
MRQRTDGPQDNEHGSGMPDNAYSVDDRSPSVRTATALPPECCRREVEALPTAQRLFAAGRFEVYYASARQIPWLLQEIGTLREVAFRAAGEGTGKDADLDLFDAYYLHLFVWDVGAKAVIGAYRLGLVDEIVARYGKRGLYTHSLFRYDRTVLQSVNPGIELGRSFVRLEYQRNYAPLLLLWRGIGRFVARTPRYGVLFGSVSISNRYASASRQLIVRYLIANRVDSSLARHVKPRRPPEMAMPAGGAENEACDLRSIDDLSCRIASIEPDRKGIPILLKHYLGIGGRLLGFNTDANFGMVLDGLLMVDLRRAEPRTLARYMGAPEAASFLAHHAGGGERQQRAR